jgi:hypothetical protein
MEEKPPHHCVNCDDSPVVDIPGKPVKWMRSVGMFICTTCGEYIPKTHVPLHTCKRRINAFFMKVYTDVPAEND